MTFRLALFGAPPDTPNMGVSALFMSVVSGIAKYINPVEFVVFDNGLGRRSEILVMPDGKEVTLIRFGARGGRRYYRPENLATMLLASRFGPIGAWLNEGIRLVDSCAAVLDVSGGDSFSDIYGQARFDNVFRPKAIAINRGIPLILLPQTYGPYNDQKVRALAAWATKGASMAWARDKNSFEILKALLGESFNPEIHLCGVDMAFSLPPSPANHLLPVTLQDWIEKKRSDTPLVGFNISGLIYNDPKAASSKYGFKADYQQVVTGFLGKILAETNARVVLISHVMDQPGHYESDLAACQAVAQQLGENYSSRVVVAPVTLDQSQVKWLIAHMDWFCGTRMHSTIAGLSSGVPTATISYSDKAIGVFDTCGQSEQVCDPRKLDTTLMVFRLYELFKKRELIKQELGKSIHSVISTANDQLNEITNILVRH